MSFNASLKILTVNLGPNDNGTFILDVSVKTIYDGMAPSLKVNSHLLTIYKIQIGLGTITDQTLLMGTPLVLSLPSIVTNPAGITTSITWAATPLPIWLSLSSSSITINSSDAALISTTTAITITATDSISGLSVSETFKVFFICTKISVNCSTSV